MSVHSTIVLFAIGTPARGLDVLWLPWRQRCRIRAISYSNFPVSGVSRVNTNRAINWTVSWHPELIRVANVGANFHFERMRIAQSET
jgi:hypothetical protein